jgi:hypothetical protein
MVRELRSLPSYEHPAGFQAIRNPYNVRLIVKNALFGVFAVPAAKGKLEKIVKIFEFSAVPAAKGKQDKILKIFEFSAVP